MINPVKGWSINPDKMSFLSGSERLALLEESNNGVLDLPTVQKFLQVMLPSEGQPTAAQFRDVVEVLGQSQKLDSILQSILTNPEQLSSLKSFGHSTGMERVELAVHGQFSLRLHFWMFGDGECFTEDPHNHVYNFGSKVLSGALVTDLFRYKRGGKIGMYKIASQNSIQKPRPEQIGNASIQAITPPKGIILTNRDFAYTMSHIPIHRVRKGSPNEPIITLNIRGEAVKEQSTFFRDENAQNANLATIKVDIENRLNLLRQTIKRI